MNKEINNDDANTASRRGMPYAPYRDLVNCLPSLARQAAYSLDEDSREPWLKDLLSSTNTSEPNIGDAVIALANYINHCRKPELDDIPKVLQESGFETLNPIAQLVVLARLGQSTLAYYYATSRDALRIDEKPLALDALLDTATKVCEELKLRASSDKKM